MKKVLILGLLVALLSSCANYNTGELVGVQGRKAYIEPDPYGMLFIPTGSFTMGPSDQDVAWTQNALARTVSIDAFWMDETEITNNEYRQFIHWVRDSIMRKGLAAADIQDFQYIDQNDQPVILPSGEPRINWDTPLDVIKKDREGNMKAIVYGDPLSGDPGLDLYYTGEDQLSPRGKELKVENLIYNYYWVDFQQAARHSNRMKLEYNTGDPEPTVTYGGQVVRPDGTREDVEGRSSFVNKDWVMVYPDTLCWIADFTYSYNEPMATMYFWHPSYDNYPVVGVNWKQANAFCSWRTSYLNDALFKSGLALVQDYRLPMEAEWEFAARGNLDHSMYPWGGVYLRNKIGCFVANFKPLRGNYVDDGALATERVATFSANEYGLYDMAGNVAEWTISAYDPSAYVFSATLNPDYKYNAKPNDPPVMKRKVIRGGSWKDVARYLQVSVRDYEYQDTAKSYIGFRCVRSYLGTN
ncbi:MAG: SUMF1/EgtB/PvdO family nonheme iron enzyme [Bacteroidales bacterium]|nr:SUMF1/EgtB/PvdO family nonheme iron enzyme [Bacteroidales bacterium]MDT8430650.1 SUMF1/EgtB/PvdO family nonheme iron enzyme [Bacteroidales bacterium]